MKISVNYSYDNADQVTASTRAIARSYTYDAFGNTETATGPAASANKYRFSTKPLETAIPTNPLYYYGYRFYNPITGRWLNRDPIEEKGGLNLYGFVGNDGVGRVDVLGRNSLTRYKIPFGIGIALAIAIAEKIQGVTTDEMPKCLLHLPNSAKCTSCTDFYLKAGLIAIGAAQAWSYVEAAILCSELKKPWQISSCMFTFSAIIRDTVENAENELIEEYNETRSKCFCKKK